MYGTLFTIDNNHFNNSYREIRIGALGNPLLYLKFLMGENIQNSNSSFEVSSLKNSKYNNILI